MANGRMLNKSISIDPEFNAMSVDARELFLKAIPHLDRDGLIEGHPSKLWATIDPFHADRLQRMGEYIQEWIDANLVIRYDTGRDIVLFFTGFRKNNPNIKYEREATSPYPPPPGWIRTRAGLVPNDPDLRRVIAEQYDPRSSYRGALLQETDDHSRPSHDQVTTSSRPTHEEDQDQDVVVDQTITKPPSVCVERGGAGGKTSGTFCNCRPPP